LSTQYNGIADNERLHSTFSISSSTNTAPIQITTTTPHDLTEGDRVLVTGHATNTAANGLWAVHVVDASNVQLYQTYGGTASTGNGIGGASGTIRGIGLLPTYALPSDGDDITAASVNVGLEDHGDRTQYIVGQLGTAKIVSNLFRGEPSADYTRSLGTLGTVGAGTAPYLGVWILTNANSTFIRCVDNGLNGSESADFYSGSYPAVFTGDTVEATFSTTVNQTITSPAAMYFGIGYELFDFGTSPTLTPTMVQGSAVLVQAGLIGPLTLNAKFTVLSTSGRLKQLQLYVCARSISGLQTYCFEQDRIWESKVIRSTSLYE